MRTFWSHCSAILSLHDVVDRCWFHGLVKNLAARTRFVDLESLAAMHAKGGLREPCLALTFDDGYKSVRSIVEPVCSELGIPFTAFVCGDVATGGPVPWYDRVALLARRIGVARTASYWPAVAGTSRTERHLLWTLKEIPLDDVLRGLQLAERDEGLDIHPLRSRYMDVADLRALARNELATIGSHAHRHPILSRLTREQQRYEIEGGIAALRPIVSNVKLFAYPNGKPQDYDQHVMGLLRDRGIVAAVTTVQRCLHSGDDVMQLPRLGVSEGDSAGRLEIKRLLPWPGIGDARERFHRSRVRARVTLS